MIEISCDENWEDLINKTRLQKILIIFLKHLFDAECGISVYLTDDGEIQKLNKEFRGKDCPTDILSWAYDDNDLEMNGAQTGDLASGKLAGELIVSAERVRQQAVENGWDFETELIRLLAHGCAHLAGLDHESSTEEAREMLELEIELLKEVDLTNIY
jgi:probable rRNA maturation factor